MRLNDEQKAILLENLNKHWVSKNCACCGNDNWSMSDTIFELREFFGGGMVLGGNSAIVPVVIATCTKCGHTMFFNAIMLGIVPLKKENMSQESKGATKSD